MSVAAVACLLKSACRPDKETAPFSTRFNYHMKSSGNSWTNTRNKTHFVFARYKTWQPSAFYPIWTMVPTASCVRSAAHSFCRFIYAHPGRTLIISRLVVVLHPENATKNNHKHIIDSRRNKYIFLKHFSAEQLSKFKNKIKI